MMPNTAFNLPLTDEQYQRGLIHTGDPARLNRFVQKLKSGTPVTYGAIGGSITAGASAQEGGSYGPLLADWLDKQTSVTFINAGIGATNSLFGSFRAGKDLLCHQPDLITIEYAVNDSNNPATALSYEALVRQCVSQHNAPLVMTIFTMHRDGTNTQDIHIPIARHYDLPTLSYRDAIYPLIQAGQLTWEDLSPDEVHPNDVGHAYMFKMLSRSIQTPADDTSTDITPVGEWLNQEACRYMGKVLDATQLNIVSNDGWTQGPHKAGYTGWQADQPGATLTLQFDGQLAYIGYKKYAGDMGKVSATLDGKVIGEFDGFYEKPVIQQWAGGHTVIEPLCTNLAPDTHTLELKLLEDTHPATHGHAFDLGYLLVSDSRSDHAQGMPSCIHQ